MAYLFHLESFIGLYSKLKMAQWRFNFKNYLKNVKIINPLFFHFDFPNNPFL